MNRLLAALLILAPASVFAQELEAPPPITEDLPFEEQVSNGADPFETMTDPPAEEVEVAQDEGAPTMEDFESTLSPHGQWISTRGYGRVWVPRTPYPGWRPYTHGRWVYTADGWSFRSRFAWGWAPFHYGRWVHLQRHGWSWIPGYEYSPAWVQWRHGGGYVAWAPLGPAGVAGNYYATPSLWFAVRTNHFGARIRRRNALPTARSSVVFGRTRLGWPQVGYVQSATGRPIRKVRARRRVRAARKANRVQRSVERRERKEAKRFERRERKEAQRVERRERKQERRERKKARRIERKKRRSRRR